MKNLERLTNENDILKLLYDFDEVFPHLKEKVSDYNEYALKLKENAFVYKATVDGSTFGVLIFYANDTKTQKAYISLIGVKAEYRSMGLGKHLLDYCEEISRENGMKKIILEVDDDNLKAIDFYNKNGFKYKNNASVSSVYMEKPIGCD